jgi:hypothetical protein
MGPADDPTSIGCVLVSIGALTDRQLKQAVEDRQQASPDELLGHFMVGREIIQPDQLKRALELQAKLRNSKNKTARALAQAEVASACVDRVRTTAARVHGRLRLRYGANASGK